MSRVCTICNHPKLLNIDRHVLRGDALNSVAQRFQCSPDALGGHKKHMQFVMAKAAAMWRTGRPCWPKSDASNTTAHYLYFNSSCSVLMPSRRLEDRIRELSARLASSSDSEFSQVLGLQATLSEHSRRVRNKTSASILSWPEHPHERRKSIMSSK